MLQRARKNTEWQTPATNLEWQHVQVELLMDLRDELQHLNRILDCRNFQEIPAVLRGISRKLPARKAAKRKKRS